jgi:hypothetical protein
MPFTREFDADRKAQGFRSQMHLDAFYTAYDHVKSCGECGQPGPAAWLEGDASWQPTETRCDESRRLDAITQAVNQRAKWISDGLAERYPRGPYAVYSYYPATQRELAMRNQSPESAVKLAERETARGCRVHVSLDTCG